MKRLAAAGAGILAFGLILAPAPARAAGRGGDVKPGQTFTYRLRAGTDSVGVWPYHDHSPSMMESIAGGMYGAVSILAPGQPRADREFVTFFESQLGFETINGRAFVGNTPVLHARVGETVQWDVLALGDEHHTFHVHGHRWRDPDGSFVDTQTVGPADSFTFRIKEDRPGTSTGRWGRKRPPHAAHPGTTMVRRSARSVGRHERRRRLFREA
jgi:FtsP/CotA-like multicopper oxidase with cupredoxin domain